VTLENALPVYQDWTNRTVVIGGKSHLVAEGSLEWLVTSSGVLRFRGFNLVDLTFPCGVLQSPFSSFKLSLRPEIDPCERKALFWSVVSGQQARTNQHDFKIRGVSRVTSAKRG
jgi:hypothetical protein